MSFDRVKRQPLARMTRVVIFRAGATVRRTTADHVSHLRDVRDGHPLSPEIACQLLTCDDDTPARAARDRACAERAIPPRRHHLLAQGLHPAHQPLPRLLRLLHLSPRSRRARRAHHDARRSARGRAAGREAGLHRGAVLAGRQAGDALPRDARNLAPRSAIAARCIIWRPCASWCCAKRACCRTPIPAC